PAALGYRTDSALHDRLRTPQLRIRPPDLRRAAAAVPCGRGDVPDDVVRRLAAHRARRRPRPPYAGARVAQPAERPPPLDDGRRDGVRPRDAVLRTRIDAVRLRPTLDGRD